MTNINNDHDCIILYPPINPSATPTRSNQPTKTPTQTNTKTPTPQATTTPTTTRTPTQTSTITATPSNTATKTATITPTRTKTPTVTPTKICYYQDSLKNSCGDFYLSADDAAWKSTSVSFNINDRIYVTTIGCAYYGASLNVGPDGVESNDPNSQFLRVDGRLNNSGVYSSIFKVGSLLDSYTTSSGILELRIFDTNYSNNAGGFCVCVKKDPDGECLVSNFVPPPASPTPTPTNTQTPTKTPGPTRTPTATCTTTPTLSATPTNTATVSGTTTNTPTRTSGPPPTNTSTPTPTVTPTPTQEPLEWRVSSLESDVLINNANSSSSLISSLGSDILLHDQTLNKTIISSINTDVILNDNSLSKNINSSLGVDVVLNDSQLSRVINSSLVADVIVGVPLPTPTTTLTITPTLTDTPTQTPTLTPTPTNMLPGAPASLVVVPGSNQISVTWSAPTNNGGSNITGYVLQISREGEGITQFGFNSGVTSYTVINLNNDISYTIRIAATNAFGTGEYRTEIATPSA